MRRPSRLWVAAVLVSGSAFASPDYPTTLKMETGASVYPPCTVCHTDLSGNTGTITRDFGLALKDRGLTGSNSAKLKSLLAEFRQQKVDTDGDGTIDFDELKAGRNPNVKGPNDCFSENSACGSSPDAGTGGGTGGGEEELPQTTYGCSAGAGGSALAGLVFAGAALVSALRRQRS